MFRIPPDLSAPPPGPGGAIAELRGRESREREATVFVIDTDREACDLIRDVAGTMHVGCEVYASVQAFLDAYRPSRPGCLVTELRVPG